MRQFARFLRDSLRPLFIALIMAGILLVWGCGEDETDKGPMAREELVSRFSLQTLGPTPYPPDNPPNQERIELGRLLFFDPIIGGEKDVSCATCHHPDFGFSDGRQLRLRIPGNFIRLMVIISIVLFPLTTNPGSAGASPSHTQSDRQD